MRGRLKNQVDAARKKQEHSACSAFLIVAAPRVKNTETTEPKSYDAGKKESDVKRHIAVGTQESTARTQSPQGSTGQGAKLVMRQCDYVGQPFKPSVQVILHEHVTVRIAKRQLALHG